MSDETTEERIRRRLKECGRHGLSLPNSLDATARVMAEEIERLRSELLAKMPRPSRGAVRYK